MTIINGLQIMAEAYNMSIIEFVAAYMIINTGFLTVGYFLIKETIKMVKEELEG